MILKQSTAATVVVGPVLDSAGAAVTTAVTANFSLSKNGTVNALTSETVTHSTNGYYTIALTSSNTDTLGRVEIIVNDSAMSMATHRYNVIVAASYDLLVSTGGYSTLDAAGIRTAVGLASANLDTQLSTIDTVVDNIEVDTQDIQSRLPTSLSGGLMQAYVVGASNSGADTISSRIATNIVDGSYSWPAALGEIADAVYDEPYAGHTTPGTYGFLWDKWRKSNPTITGEVTAAVTPTTTTFSTDITGYADTAFDNAVLVFINGSTNADFRGVVSGYLQANGQVTITPALPQAPVAGDEFVIAITSFVYTTTQTQSGLATSAGVTAAFTEIKGATWDSGTDTLEAIRNASGGGGGVSALLPAIGVVPVRVDQTMLTAFVGETIDVAIVVYQSDGTTPMDLSGKTLEVCFESTSTTDVAVVSNANITVSGDDNNIVTFAYPSAVTGSVANYHWSLRDASAPKTVWQYGTLYCKRAALKDA